MFSPNERINNYIQSFNIQNGIDDILELLKDFPELGSIEIKDKRVRGLKVTKQIRVFYRLSDTKIIILAFFDVRQNPKKRTE